MRFSEITANEDVLRALSGMVDSGKIPHAIMLHEDDGGGAVGLANAFLQYLYCKSRSGGDSCGECPSCNRISKLIHPDVHYIFPVNAGNLSVNFAKQWRELVLGNPVFTENDLTEALGIEGKSSLIAVGEAKAMLETLSLSALEGGYRSVVIYLPEKMNQEAANRLLKVIEEPPRLTQFVLITHSPEKILQTIASRCQRIRVMPCSGLRKTRVEFPEFDTLMDALVRKDLSAALEASDALAALPSRESAKSFCVFAGERLRDIFLAQQGLSAADERTGRLASSLKKTFPRTALQAFDRARMLIERNVNLKILFTDLANRLYMIL